MNDQQSAGISTGSISILAIFVVLCLTTLATLSLVSARADHVLTGKTIESTQEFYAADGKAEEQLAYVVQTLQSEGIEGISSDIYTVEELEDGRVRVSYTVEVNEIKEIYVIIDVDMDEGSFERVAWKSQVRSDAAQEKPSLSLMQ